MISDVVASRGALLSDKSRQTCIFINVGIINIQFMVSLKYIRILEIKCNSQTNHSTKPEAKDVTLCNRNKNQKVFNLLILLGKLKFHIHKSKFSRSYDNI